MKVMKASAGSGKTTRLSQTYLDILLGSREKNPYRSILAVTFTNKATAEMKSRILRDLASRARTDEKAGRILTDILHDYSAFSITTIDKFFQRTLKAFSREIGQFADYQIELDRDSVISEAMDRILDSLTEDRKDLLEWIRKTVGDRLENGQRANIDEGLYEMGSLLKSEEHRKLAAECGIDDLTFFDKKNLEKIRKECREEIRRFEEKYREISGQPLEKGQKIKKPGVRALNADPELAGLFEEPYRKYSTACIIDKSIFSLGFAGEFYRRFADLLKEKNLMCLDESNLILRDIIDDSDAPFVYEKLGVRYRNFLLDEFQDTSNIQWDNFLPLLRESEANGGRNLIVGDVKQSIYRFRDSDWNLLGSKVAEVFPNAEVIPLDCNWRSAGNIVNFNNSFFEFAASALGVSEIYSDVRQEIRCRDEQEGSVQISFCDDQIAEVISSIGRACEAGAGYGDIAVLVRGRAQGSEIASALIENGIPVISDDSLSVKSSVVVRRLVSLLSCMDNPQDRIGSFLADTMNVEYPENYHSLVDLCENLLRELKEYDCKSFEGETLFIQAFMDELSSWTAVNGNNLRHFLKYWEEKDFCIGSPENVSSVRILTIHKSKGLEFPYVIFPFAEKVTLYKNGVHWCRYKDGIFPVELGPLSEQTLFADDYHEERRKQAIDNINIFYVALTRAGRGLHIISKTPTKKLQEAVRKNKTPEYSNFAEILYVFGGACEDRTYGTMYDFTRLPRPDAAAEKDFVANYPSIALDCRLTPSEDAADFFGDDGETGTQASPRRYGIALHSILSEIRGIDDLDDALHRAVEDGSLASSEADAARSLLFKGVSSHPEWFGKGDAVVRNERAVFDSDGREYRPDKVVVLGDSTLIVDFKFAKEEDGHVRQISKYMSIYRKLGYPDVHGYLWYVLEGRVKEYY